MTESQRRTPPKLPRTSPAPLTTSPALEERFAAGDDVLAWWRALAPGPLLEPHPDGTVTVTFWWSDSRAEQVLLFANRITDERNLAASLMRRLPGSDLWHLSYRMEPDWRASYGFVPVGPGQTPPWHTDQAGIREVLDLALPDPGNPRRISNRVGNELSVVELPAAPPQPWIRQRRGSTRRRIEVLGPAGRRVWLSPAPFGGEAPLVIGLDGEFWLDQLSLTVDNLAEDGLIRAPHVLLLDSGGRSRRWRELSAGALAGYLATDLLDWVRNHLPISPRPQDVVVVGQSLGGLTALHTVLDHSDRIASAVSQSASLWQEDLAVPPLFGAGVRIHLEVGRQEWVLDPPHRELAPRLSAAGVDARLTRFNGGHDYACWQGGIGDGLRWLLA